LIKRFLRQKISASAFETAYLELRRESINAGNDYCEDILDELFIDLDAFCSDPDLFDEGDLTEKELRESCARTLAALESKGYKV